MLHEMAMIINVAVERVSTGETEELCDLRGINSSSKLSHRHRAKMQFYTEQVKHGEYEEILVFERLNGAHESVLSMERAFLGK